jgi:proteasome accessory factor A
MVHRPIVNSRDEALCGTFREAQEQPATADMARLHVIFYDNTLCHVASLLKVGVMQIVLAMIEAGRIKPGLALEDPLDALLRWSHDPTSTPARG